MIITCPYCSARYRLAATVIADNTRLRCAACHQSWEAVDAVVNPVADAVAAAGAEGAKESAPMADGDQARGALKNGPAAHTPLVPTIVAAVLGTALVIGAATVWTAQIDPEQAPAIGSALALLVPRSMPLDVVFTAQTAALPSGDRLLEIKGRVRNTGTVVVTLPDLEARLAGPDGTVRRWRIAAPAAKLAPGESAGFGSTATGFPAEATLVGIRPAG